MDRWLTVTASQELERLRRRLDGERLTPDAVPTTRGWADALLALWLTDHPSQIATDPLVRVGTYAFSQVGTGEETSTVLVAAERCVVATKSALLPVIRPAEWRNAKRALTECGLDQGIVEELVTPTTTDGAIGSVEPQAVCSYVADLQDDLKTELVRYFANDLKAYAQSLRPLADFDEHSDLPAAVEVLVPWSAVVMLRDADGSEHPHK